MCDDPAYIQRALYYLARLFGGQLETGAEYELLAKTIGISLVDFDLFPDLEDLHSTYRFYDPVHRRELSDMLEIHFIELVKFKEDKPQTLRSPFEKWLHILKFGEFYERGVRPVPETLKVEEGIEMALDAMKRAYATSEVRELIEFRMKAHPGLAAGLRAVTAFRGPAT
ncbi:MAG: Rpn family recombination-promoting nuclease/putative transposase [Candidatus Riflebacteria bacterium]|nr:Rpn family recombination-promoting nuclease/putative transposase [Candidatus Riflebacteria bacterium]